MAYVVTQECSKCEQATIHTNGKCNSCRDRERRREVAEWNALTVDEKLQNLRKRIEALEAQPPIY